VSVSSTIIAFWTTYYILFRQRTG